MPSTLRLLLALLALSACTPCLAQGFDAQVLPPRFEDSAQPGNVYRNVIEIQSGSKTDTRFSVRTADWTLDAAGEVRFDYGLAPGSCRPWVGLEATEVVVDAMGRRRFRFEVAVPPDATSGQCRFAIMIEGPPYQTPSGMAVSGRIGVIVYLDIGDASAQLRIEGIEVQEVEGRRLPTLLVSNAGNAHGRLQGFVAGRDGEGRRLTLLPGTDPILPGIRRHIVLYPAPEPDAPPPVVTYPLELRGQLEWDGQRIPVEGTARQ